jgi:hypothetical protein
MPPRSTEKNPHFWPAGHPPAAMLVGSQLAEQVSVVVTGVVPSVIGIAHRPRGCGQSLSAPHHSWQRPPAHTYPAAQSVNVVQAEVSVPGVVIPRHDVPIRSVKSMSQVSGGVQPHCGNSVHGWVGQVLASIAGVDRGVDRRRTVGARAVETRAVGAAGAVLAPRAIGHLAIGGAVGGAVDLGPRRSRRGAGHEQYDECGGQTHGAILGRARHRSQAVSRAVCYLPAAMTQVAADRLAAEGNELFQQGDFASAAERFERAATIFPSHHLAWKGLGHALLCLGRPVEAARAFDRAIGLRPRAPPRCGAARWPTPTSATSRSRRTT